MIPPISLEQALEWEVSKKGLIVSTIHANVPFLFNRWVNKFIKQYNYYRTFNEVMPQEQALNEAKQLIK